MIRINPEIIDVAPAIKMDLGRRVERSPFKPQGTLPRSSGASKSAASSRAELNCSTRLSSTPGARHWDLPPSTRVLPQTSTHFATAAGSELGRAGASQHSAWTQAQHQDSSTHLYPVIFHILHTGHSDEGRSPPVHCLQLHVDQEAMGWALGPGRTQVSGERGHASGSRAPRQLSQQHALLQPSSQPRPVWVRALPAPSGTRRESGQASQV